VRLPEPMLAKSGPLPDGPEWRFELKLDGFRTAPWRACSCCSATDRG